MRIISRAALRNFWGRHADARQPLSAWYALMKSRQFRNPQELKAQFGTASILPDDHVCFNIGGNKYRLVVHIRYDVAIVFVKARTHA